jgi:hypothetical protein
MFIERDGNRLRAWILPSSDSPGGEALEFFSGDRQTIVRVLTGERGEPSGFVAANGRTHLATPGSRTYDATDPVSNDGARYFVDFAADSIVIADTAGACELDLRPIGVLRQRDRAPPQRGAMRERVLMYLDTSRAECRSGRWESSVLSAMDLGDGTVLLTMPAYAVRVRMSDFAPVGKTSQIRAIDGARVRALLRVANRGEAVADPNGLLIRKLGRAATGGPANQR